MLIEKLKLALKEALKSQDALKLSVLRMVISVVNNKKIEKALKSGSEAELSDEDILEILNKEAKKRKEAIALFLEGGREDLASKEEAELKIISAYLPALMSEEDIKKVVLKIIAGTPNKDFGPIMKEVMKELRGKADASLITRILREELK